MTPVGLLALVTLVLQMSGLTLCMHASRTHGGALYSVSAAVFLTELLKLALCCAFAAGRTARTLSVPFVVEQLLYVLRSALPLAMPSALFVATQQLNLYAATELDAVTFQGTPCARADKTCCLLFFSEKCVLVLTPPFASFA